MAGDENVAEEVREAVHVIVERLMPKQQKAFLVFVAGADLQLITQGEADLLIAELGLRSL